MNGALAGRVSSGALAPPCSSLQLAAVAGAIAGVVYALSPLTVVFVVLMVPLFRWLRHGLPADERRRVTIVLAVALALRVAAVAVLLITADPRHGSFGTFFGDEEFYQLRGLRLYNIWMGIPIPRESFLYAYDVTGYSSYQELLVLLQIFFGPAPYGIHLVNACLYVTATILMFRLVRPSFGPAAAIVSFAALLFLPSVFMWSVSALKESLFLALTAAVIGLAVHLPRSTRVWHVVARALAVVAGIVAIESVRPGGGALTALGIAAGYLLRFVTLRRFLAVTSVVAAIVAVPVIARSPAVHERLEQAARYHRGHVFTPGHSYKLLDQRFYTLYWAPLAPPQMSGTETARYVVRAVVNFVGQPLPWDIESRAELAFLPEQAIWYALVLLAPVGLVVGWRRDALLTSVLAGYSVVSAGIIAINSGNIGTLVRHRALVLPFMIWTSALGLVAILASRRTPQRTLHADHR